MTIRKDELDALDLLKCLFVEYQSLTLSDKPDLIDEINSIGVEVTTALNPSVKEREGYFEKHLKGKDIQTLSQKEINKFEQNGLHIVCEEKINGKKFGKILAWTRVFNADELNLLKVAVKKKYDKIYQPLDRIDLYILFSQVCPESIIDAFWEDLLRTAHECERKHGKIFTHILIDFRGTLVSLNLNHDEIKKIRYDENGKIKEVI